MSHLKRGRAALPPPKLDQLLPAKQSLALQLAPTKSTDNYNNDIGFDEQEKKKIESLAEPYKDKPISELPQILETTINNYYNNNATSLIGNANLIGEAINGLNDILDSIHEAKETALKNSEEEHIVYESLKSLDVTNAKDTEDYVTQNKRKALEKLQKVYDAAAIPQEWISLLTKPKLSEIPNLNKLYQKISEIDSDMRSKEVPKLLEKMHKCVEQRKESLSKYLYGFSTTFTEFLQSRFFNNIEFVIDFAKNKEPVKCIPKELPNKEEIVFPNDRNGFSDEMVQFQPTHTIEKFNELNEKMKNILSVGIKESFSILRRKIRKEDLREELRNIMIKFIENKFEEWNQIALNCYQIELSVTVDDVREEVKQRKSREQHEK
ncbi:hypothetical protein GPJ56_004518 [Histomonas meleagridis]|uniref:uncharacterized protein n=1 Tax=Histomonas meleagridis TaxID=135588 RepID=UPI003559E2C4|nr:hypothetical protein GPJ56_004518 [Histomonas meleagridis]KAH0797337.1 hypothetical protein GO595_009840 [Histomonas meleagridis]